jgi:hypothetical protein
MKRTGELQLLIAPLRFVWGMFLSGIFLLLSPLLLLGLLFGSALMTPEEIGLMKVILVVVGPFAFIFWWIIIGRYRAKSLMSPRSETGCDFSNEEIAFLATAGKPRHIRNFVLLLVSLCGSVFCAHLFYSSGDQEFLIGVLAGILSPAIMVGFWRLMRRTSR